MNNPVVLPNELKELIIVGPRWDSNLLSVFELERIISEFRFIFFFFNLNRSSYHMFKWIITSEFNKFIDINYLLTYLMSYKYFHTADIIWKIAIYIYIYIYIFVYLCCRLCVYAVWVCVCVQRSPCQTDTLTCDLCYSVSRWDSPQKKSPGLLRKKMSNVLYATTTKTSTSYKNTHWKNDRTTDNGN